MAYYLNVPKKLMQVSLLVSAILVTALGSLSCGPGGYSGEVETVTISEGHNETRTLIYVAEERGLFAANGINVVYKDNIFGAAATNALMKGKIELAAGSEFVIVGGALKKADIRSIAVIDRFENTYIIGRADKGIKDIADLEGKKIAITRGTSPEFYLGRFLQLHGIGIEQVTLIDGTPAQSVEAIVSGSVDAVAIFQPEASTIIRTLDNNAVVWPAQSGQFTYFNIFGTASWVASHPEVITRLLRALSQAEDYVARHPDEVKALVQKRLQYDDAYMNAIWTEHRFSLSLDQSLIITMEDETRWMISNNLTNEKTVPNYLDFIYADSLKSVKPGAVSITGK